MAENLHVSRYRNGDMIPEVKGYVKFRNLRKGAWCSYQNKAVNENEYGKLYNGYAVRDPRGIAPEGWHVPSDNEWNELIEYLGGNSEAGGKIKEKGTEHWKNPNEGATNETGLTALPSGMRWWDGLCTQIGKLGCFWSSSGHGNHSVCYHDNTCLSMAAGFCQKGNGYSAVSYTHLTLPTN